jgi:dephospho-CoA kinase
MMRIGLTGNIGTGKSTVASVFQILGVPVYHADQRSREFLDSDELKAQIMSLFGKQVFDAEQKVDRKALAGIVFNDKARLSELNAVIHPLVEHDFNVWCNSHQENDYIIHEAAILYESGFDRLFEAIILVTAPEEICITRVMKRDGISREMVLNRIHNQWTQEEKVKLAAYRIINDESSFLIPQVLTIHEKLRSKTSP